MWSFEERLGLALVLPSFVAVLFPLHVPEKQRPGPAGGAALEPLERAWSTLHPLADALRGHSQCAFGDPGKDY